MNKLLIILFISSFFCCKAIKTNEEEIKWHTHLFNDEFSFDTLVGVKIYESESRLNEKTRLIKELDDDELLFLFEKIKSSTYASFTKIDATYEFYIEFEFLKSKFGLMSNCEVVTSFRKDYNFNLGINCCDYFNLNEVEEY